MKSMIIMTHNLRLENIKYRECYNISLVDSISFIFQLTRRNYKKGIYNEWETI